jgi:lipopolysaccharide export LptBFGC system permease protein LptF
MSGRHPLSTFAMPAALAVALGLFTWWLVAGPGPMLKREERAYLVSAVPNVVRNLSPGRTELQLGPFYLSSRFRDGNAFLDAYIYVPETGDEPAWELRAERVEIGFDGDLMKIKLYDWRTVLHAVSINNETGVIGIRLDDLVEERNMPYKRPRYQTSRMLRDALETGELDEKKRLEALFVIQHRYALGATYLLFLLIGAPTGLILRRGTQLGALAVAVAYATLYYVLDLRMGKELGTSGVLQPVVAAWMTTGLGAAAGSLLAFKALRE